MVLSSTIGYGESSSTQERERLILAHLPQVRWIAIRIHEKLPHSFNLEDLISVGIVGLINAIDCFDPSRNTQLKTYAEYKIRGAILDSIRGFDGIPVNRRKQVKEIEAAIQAIEQRNGAVASEEEIAAELKLSLPEYQDLLYELRGVSLSSLDSPVEGTEDVTLEDCLASGEDLPLKGLERDELERLLALGVSYLTRPEQLILSLYYREERNMRDIAKILGISLTRVSQLKSQSILRLRSFLERKWPASRGVL